MWKSKVFILGNAFENVVCKLFCFGLDARDNTFETLSVRGLQHKNPYKITASSIQVNRSVAQIPQCTSPISHNAPFLTDMHMCANFCYKWCIVGYLPNAFSDLWEGSVAFVHEIHFRHPTIEHRYRWKRVGFITGCGRSSTIAVVPVTLFQ